MSKKYYWIKLKTDFFNKREIKKLRRIAGGDTYTIIYLKLQLLSAKNEGVIKFEGTEKDLIEQLELELDEERENISVTLAFLQANNLMEQISDTDYLLSQVCDSIGKEGSSAERVRKHRERRKALQCNSEALQCNSDTLQCNTYIDIDKDIDKNIDKELDKKKNKSPLIEKEKDFDKFWKSYPRKIAKAKAKTAFMRLYKEMPNIEELLSILERHKSSKQWKQSDGKYIPHATTWLNQQRWEDELEEEVELDLTQFGFGTEDAKLLQNGTG